jgi:hypothetical protein
MVGGALLVHYARPWILMEVLTTFIPVHRLLHGACGLLPEGIYHVACMHISLIEFIIAVGDEQFPIPEYMPSGMRALAFIKQ